MKLQKRFLRKYKDKNYYKFMINIPPEIVKESGFEEGDEIEVSGEGKVITLRKKGG